MRQLLIVSAAVLLLASGCKRHAEAVAVVNGEPIPAARFQREWARVLQLTQGLTGPSGLQLARMQLDSLIHRLIDDELLWQEAQRRKLRLSDEDLDQWIATEKKRQEDRAKQLKAELEAERKRVDEARQKQAADGWPAPAAEFAGVIDTQSQPPLPETPEERELLRRSLTLDRLFSSMSEDELDSLVRKLRGEAEVRTNRERIERLVQQTPAPDASY
jgi:SurA N-terminal domain